MGEKSAIEWTEATWNPVTGCTKISPGCDNCYAERLALRLQAMGQPNYANGFELTLQERMLELPLKWKTPQIIFVNSMSDLFHEDIPEAFIREVFAVMERADWHVFQVLTKRPKRMAELAPSLPWPDHIWAGTSVELDRYAWRSNVYLRSVPAAVRFVSAEPLLGPLPSLALDHLQWLITGGESGPQHRDCDPDWVRDLRDRCLAESVAFFHKQWGGRTSKSRGRLLDGQTWDQFPQVSRTMPV